LRFSAGRNLVSLLKLASPLVGSLFALGLSAAMAEAPLSHPAVRISSKLVIAPSSSRLAGGTAKLAAGPLSRDDSTYVGDYQIKVFPYFFKSENGRLFIKAPETAFRRMTGGLPTTFAGHARTNGSGLIRGITAQATPSANDRGALTFTVATENGPLVFNTSYRIVKP
jgi:hypothetical protein